MSNVDLTIQLEVSADGDSVTGHATAGDGTGDPIAFSGWLGLISALDSLIEQQRHPVPEKN